MRPFPFVASYGAGARHWFVMVAERAQLRDRRGRIRWFSARGADRACEQIKSMMAIGYTTEAAAYELANRRKSK